MKPKHKWCHCLVRLLLLHPLVMLLLLPGGCATPEQTAGLAVGVTALGAHSPNNEIEQIYYMGVFDPQEQVPPTVYRVRVHGQASFISNTRFASGWVRADLIDSLSTQVKFDKDGRIKISRSDEDQLSGIKTGRRLMMFGPEGFREAPKDHRLVIVMGSSPEAFFQAVDESIGVVAEVQREQIDSEFSLMIFAELRRVQTERIRLSDLYADVLAEYKQ